MATNIKCEPDDDPDYDPSLDSQSDSPAPVPSPQRKSSRNNILIKSKSQIRDAMYSKNHGAPKLSNVVDSLLMKNELLLAQNDAVAFKPNSRVSRNTFDSRKMEAGEIGDATFLVSQQSQARIRKSQGTDQDVVAGRLLRPRSPTRKCPLPKSDKTHLSVSLIESDLQDKDSEKLFRVQKHDLVSAISCQAMFSSKGNKIAANIDLTYYWCNFCPYSSTSKPALLNHMSEHRFTCRHCQYQSFSRADVIRHSAKIHEEFICMATSLKYCTILSDYLLVSKQSADVKKRKAEDDNDTEDENVSNKSQKLTDNDEESCDSDSNQPGKKGSTDDYDFFDMEVEEIEENNDHGIVTEEIPENPLPLPIPKLYPGNQTQSFQQYTSPNTAMQILPNLDDDDDTIHTISTSAKNSTKKIRPKPAPRFAQKIAPSKPTVSSSLYWSCGYCSFKSDSQWKIKHHSVSKHPGKPHRYVALILPPGATSLNDEEDDANSAKDVEIVNDSDQDSNQSSGSINGGRQTARKSSSNGKWKVNLK